MSNQFEQLLYVHCAPTIDGIKCASLFTCRKGALPTWAADLAACGTWAAERGLACRVLCQCPERLVVLLYRPRLLERLVEVRGRRAFLNQLGYPPGADLEGLLEELGRRIGAGGCAFPHEIGLFLGYPLADVRGFMDGGEAQCLFTGFWKVYANADRARRRFARYRASRQRYLDGLRTMGA